MCMGVIPTTWELLVSPVGIPHIHGGTSNNKTSSDYFHIAFRFGPC